MELSSQESLRSNEADDGRVEDPTPLRGSNGNGAAPSEAVKAEPADETPTIISKNHPVVPENGKAPPRENLANSLRGRRLAHFELIEPIGVGGMAAVIRARDTQLDRFVALKILPPEMAADEENIQRFHQEARAAAKLDHENIARVFFCGEDQRLHFIAFEFVEGDNLRTILESRGRLPVGEAVRYLLQIATGLEHAASRGVVHRDIKPSNIIITPSGKAKLVDMGLARSLEAQKDPQLTQSGMTLGTFDYISPEQALEPREADSRSDLYSLGCTFYHMLTGRPPVPEGTAAKKLHHHQHVPPMDPRQINPEVPDEVAMIMSKMMAKEPRARYQRPLFLVQHLMQIAFEVGAAADLPEGGLVVETPLPTAPGKRPLLFVTIAALALAVQIFLITYFSQSENVPEAIPVPAVAERKVNGKDVKEKESDSGVKVVEVKKGPAVIRNENDLKQALAQDGDINIKLAGIIEIGAEGLVYRGKEGSALTMESQHPEEPASLRFKLPADADMPDLLAGLVIDGAAVLIENVRFEIEAPSTPSHASAAVAVRGSSSVKLIRCQFSQRNVWQRPLLKAPEMPVASVLVDNGQGTASPRPSVLLDGCYFDGADSKGQTGGQAAIALNGSVKVDVSNCAFKPHNFLFHLRGDNPEEQPATLKLDHCSAFVHNGPAFRIDDEARCNLQVHHSIFSGRGNDAIVGDRDEPHYLYQTESREPIVRYDGQNNLYHNISWALWVLPSETGGYRLIDNLEDFNQQARAVDGKGDVGSTFKGNAPSIWELADPLREPRPEMTFRLRPGALEARTTDLKPLGIARGYWGPMNQPAYQPKEVGPGIQLASNQLVVDPDDEKRSFDVAMAQAKSGYEILVKQPKIGREVKLRAYRLDDPAFDLTIKPFDKDHRPVLVLDKTSEFDAAFFRLQDGRLHFEDLDFVLEPDPEHVQKQSLVLLGGSASCTFKSCIITLKPANPLRAASRHVPLSVVSLLDPGEAMKMAIKSSRTAPEVQFVDSFVRGEGDFLSVRSSRPFDLEIENSLLVLAGSVLDVLPAAKDVPFDPLAASLKFNQVAVYATEPVISLRGGRNGRSLYPHRVEESKGCLFVNLSNDRGQASFVFIESLEAREEALRTILDWKGRGRNGYANYQLYLVNVAPDETEPRPRLEQPEWELYAREHDSRFPLNTFVLPASIVGSPWEVTPEQVRPRLELKEEFSELGAELPPDLLLRLAIGKKDPEVSIFP